MKRFAPWLLALVLALLIFLALPVAAQPHPQSAASYLPNVQAAAAATPRPSPTPAAGWVLLRSSDTTFISASRDASTGRIYVNYIDRGNGNRLHATELISNTLVELKAAPPMPTPAAAAGPAFVPDAAKEADSASIAFDGWQYLFVSARDDGATSGPFRLWLLRFKP